ncbi:MAG TPA: glycine betaine ABC transporter substrate-binding protein [Ignavibacteria bacterium]|nr:glycine betaine ABC transporter substrate-binding protein [Ignavibacteria bacterium]HMR39901.1 glycine betaine ABC transporter substrate-binding protein [Ignavibacteria bacterium]
MKNILIILILIISSAANGQTIRVGAKHFNEGYILSEILSQLLENEGYRVERKFNLGGTLVCYQALINKEIDLYPEYTGTISEAILKLKSRQTYEELRNKLNEQELDISGEFGFNNTYALAVTDSTAEIKDLKNISDLKLHPELKLGLSHEFLNREDGWKNLSKVYDLPQKPAGLEHGLAYKALEDKQIELTDVYSTDGEIPKYNLKILEDDKNFFPVYSAVTFYNIGVESKIKEISGRLTGKISESEMQEMNEQVLYENKTFAEVAGNFLLKKDLIKKLNPEIKDQSIWQQILPKLFQHLKITSIALFFSVIIAVPLGILIYIYSYLSKPVLYVAGLLQTIPSIALLAFMIPLFGIGVVPAIAALFLYGLLPILRNTAAALFSVDPLLKEVASGIGLTNFQKLRYVEIPLSVPTVIAGIRTSAVICIGTATLAAFIGAGGLGEFIVTGLALNNTKLILMGAVPAALLAILTELFFEMTEKILVPKHLVKK